MTRKKPPRYKIPVTCTGMPETAKIESRQAKHNRESRAKDRDITIDFSRKNMRRRQRCMKDPERFLRTYFPDIFYLPFSEDQKYLIHQIAERICGGDQKAIAAPRGGGKTTISKGVIIWGLVYGFIHWVAWIEANHKFARRSIRDIKLYFEAKHGKDYFRDDFPEYCDPIRALHGQSRLCQTQTVNMEPTNINWSIDEIALPTVAHKKTPALGGIITGLGAGEAARGLVSGSFRPDFAMINDIETKETAASVVMTEKIRDGIEGDIQGLKKQDDKFGMVMLCTIIRRNCLADEYTDRKRMPQWSGTRQKYFHQWPNNLALRDEYIKLRHKDQYNEDMTYTASRKFYKDNRAEIEAGAELSNKAWYDRKREVSAIQAAYNLIAKYGLDYFNCEHQNEPPDEEGVEYLPEGIVIEKLSGFDRGVIPAGTEKITAFVDVHMQSLFWAIIGWKQGMIGSVIDYGYDAVKSPVAGAKTKDERDKAVDIAIYEALTEFRKRESAKRHIAMALVDSGWRQKPVLRFCRESLGWHASKGGAGIRGGYTMPMGESTTEGPIVLRGDRWHIVRMKSTGNRLVVFDPDRYKALVHEGFKLSDPNINGSLSLFGDDPLEHRAFAEHIAAEQCDNGKFVPVPGKNHNHWLDCITGNMVAASICGFTILRPSDGTAKPKETKSVDVRPRKQVRSIHGVKSISGSTIRTKY